MLGIGVTNGVYYLCYEFTKDVFLKAKVLRISRKSQDSVGMIGLSTVESMIAGLLAGTATSVISNPFVHLWFPTAYPPSYRQVIAILID